MTRKLTPQQEQALADKLTRQANQIIANRQDGVIGQADAEAEYRDVIREALRHIPGGMTGWVEANWGTE